MAANNTSNSKGNKKKTDKKKTDTKKKDTKKTTVKTTKKSTGVTNTSKKISTTRSGTSYKIMHKYTEDDLFCLTANLFGMPYHFPDAVDQSIAAISTEFGKAFVERIITEAPIATFIPGVPKYLASENAQAKESISGALIEASSGDFDAITHMLDNKQDGWSMRLYDFEPRFNEYMRYVNVLCRTGASFLGITDTINVGGKEYAFTEFDWRHYRYNKNAHNASLKNVATTSIKSLVNGRFVMPDVSKLSDSQKEEVQKQYQQNINEQYETLKKAGFSDSEILMYQQKGDMDKVPFFDLGTIDTEATLEEVMTKYSYVQFYIDSDSGVNESMDNASGQSFIKGLMSNADQVMKDMNFLTQSVGSQNGMEGLGSATSNFTDGVSDMLNSLGLNKGLGGAAADVISKLGGMVAHVAKGENFIIPDIWESSSYTKSYTLNVKLRSPYGSKLGYYMDIFVPLMHLICLALPRETTVNTYGSPFLVKCHVEGVFSCNLGLITGLSITRNPESFSVDGLPTEVDVSINLVDLYGDLSIAPSNDPLLFLNNSSLVEYLAVNCGMSLTKPNFRAKYDSVINTVKSAFTDVPTNIGATLGENMQNFLSRFLPGAFFNN